MTLHTFVFSFYFSWVEICLLVHLPLAHVLPPSAQKSKPATRKNRKLFFCIYDISASILEQWDPTATIYSYVCCVVATLYDHCNFLETLNANVNVVKQTLQVMNVWSKFFVLTVLCGVMYLFTRLSFNDPSNSAVVFEEDIVKNPEQRLFSSRPF